MIWTDHPNLDSQPLKITLILQQTVIFGINMCRKNFLKLDFTSKCCFFIFFLETEAKNTGYISHVSECIKIIKCGYNGVFEEKIS